MFQTTMTIILSLKGQQLVLNQTNRNVDKNGSKNKKASPCGFSIKLKKSLFSLNSGKIEFEF